MKKLKVTSIVVTHDMESCFTVTDRIAFLFDQKIAWVGNRDDAAQSGHPVLQRFIEGGKGVLRAEDAGLSHVMRLRVFGSAGPSLSSGLYGRIL